MLTVACVLRSGGDYDWEYVDRLHDGVTSNLNADHTFLVLSDLTGSLVYDWPGWWSKLEVFRPGIPGDILYFDLDTVIVGDLADIAAVRNPTALSDFNRPHRVGSGVMFLPEAFRPAVWEKFTAEPEAIMAACDVKGDQEFLDNHFQFDRWQDLVAGQIVSYKNDVIKNGLQPGNRVVCFHGQPRPREVGWRV